MAKVLKFSTISGYANADSAGSTSDPVREPVRMMSFVGLLVSILKAVHYDQGKLTEDGRAFLKGVFNYTCFMGSSFKRSLPSRGKGKDLSLDDSAEESDEAVLESSLNLPPGFEIHIAPGKLFCYVLKGLENASDDKFMNVIYKSQKDETLRFLICSYRVLQACVSILIANSSLAKEVECSPLGANAVRACTHPTVKEYADEWMIHTHSGFPYICNYVRSLEEKVSTIKKKLASKNRDKKNDEEQKKILETNEKLLKNFPPFEHLIMIGMRMDDYNRANQLNALSKNSADRKRILEGPEHPTVSAIARTCGLTTAESIEINKKIKLLEKFYPARFDKKSDTVTKTLLSGLGKSSSASSKATPEGKEKPDDESEEDSEEEIDHTI